MTRPSTHHDQRAAGEPARAVGQVLRELLGIPALQEARVCSGHAGLDRLVERVNVIGSPDPLPWVKPNELLLSTSYPLRERPGPLGDLIVALDERGVAGLAVKVQPYLEALPPDMIEASERLGFPIIVVPGHVSFDEIISQALTGILHQHAAALLYSERVHRTILDVMLTGGGLDEIVEHVCHLAGGPTAILTPDGEILAAVAPDGTADGGQLALLVLAAADDPPARRSVSVPISVAGTIHGHVVAVEGDGPLSQDVKLALEHAATVAAMVMAKANELAAVESKYQTTFVQDLVRGAFTRRDEVLERARSFGWDFGRPLVVQLVRPCERALGRVESWAGPGRVTAGVRAAVRAVDPEAAVAEFSTEVIVIVSAEAVSAAGGEGRRLGTAILNGLGGGQRVSIGISRPVRDVFGLREAYDQASRALSVGRRFSDVSGIVHFDDVGAYRLLSLVPDPAELRRFAVDMLGELIGPEETKVSLRRTLEVLLETNTNVAESARKLYFHYNTMRYRVGKLESLLGPFMDDSRRRLDLQLALMILHMEEVWA